MRATRSLVVVLWSLVALAPFGVGACHVGESPEDDAPADGSDDGDDGSTGPDASTDDGADDTSDDTSDDATDDGADDGGAIDVTACRDLVPEAELIDGHHLDRFDYNDGEEKGCVQDACHSTSPGPTAPVYTAGGAIYGSLEGGRPVAGATVYITDDAGKVLALTTSKNGFFWTTEALSPPIRTSITAGCPDDPSPMAGNAIGNCNGGGGCHNQGRQIYPL